MSETLRVCVVSIVACYEEHKLRKSTERKLRSLQEKLGYADQRRFVKKRQQVRMRTFPDIKFRILQLKCLFKGVYPNFEC